MSVCLSGHQWIDAPVAPHAVADAIAAAARPRDLAAPPPKREAARRLLPDAPALLLVLTAHAALVVIGAHAWRESLRAPDRVEEIPVEIVIEGGAAKPEGAPAETPSAANAPAQDALVANRISAEIAAADLPEPAPPEEAIAAALKREATETQRPEAAATLSAATDAPSADRTADAGQDEREVAARQRAVKLTQERAARSAQERARAAAQERVELEQERRAQARRAAQREQQAQAAQERRRIAARSLGAAERPHSATPSFDAAAYRSVVARAVSASTSRACSAGGGGRVVVALLISPSGRIASAALSSASGNSMLDAAALSAVRRAGPFPAPSNRASVSVPVVVICR